MAKIIKVDEKKSTYQGKEKTSYLFTLDDGSVGYASNKAPWEFKANDVVTYTKEVKKSSKGEYNLFTFTRDTGITSTPTVQPDLRMPPEAKNYFRDNVYSKNPKLEVPFHSMRLVMDAFIEGKIIWEELPKRFAEMNGLLLSAIDECGKENTGSEKG